MLQISSTYNHLNQGISGEFSHVDRRKKQNKKKKTQILKTETLNRMPCCENVYKATEGVEQS